MAKIHPHTGPKIRWYRKDYHGWTLDDLEERSGIPRRTINGYELRQVAPPYENCVIIAKALKVPFSLLWDMSQPPAGKPAVSAAEPRRRKSRGKLKIVR